MGLFQKTLLTVDTTCEVRIAANLKFELFYFLVGAVGYELNICESDREKELKCKEGQRLELLNVTYHADIGVSKCCFAFIRVNFFSRLFRFAVVTENVPARISQKN